MEKNGITEREGEQKQRFEHGKSRPSQSDHDNTVHFSLGELQNAREELLLNIGSLRLELNAQASIAKILSIVQENPCRLKCSFEIKNKNDSNSEFDKLYGSIHDSVKRKILDKLVNKYGDTLQVTSEQAISAGTLDIAIFPDNVIAISDNRIVFKYNEKVIGIEVKTGKTFETKHIFQIERYMIDYDLLLVTRVAYGDVFRIHTSSIKDNVLIKNISSLTQKVQQIRDNKLIRVPGEWCTGCRVECIYKSPPRWLNAKPRNASLEDYEDFLRNVDVVIDKIIMILEKEIGNLNGEIVTQQLQQDI